MEPTQKPQIEVAKRILSKPIYNSLCHIFEQKIQGCVLAGGTALAGFYAAHRRSDDLDLFTHQDIHQKSTVLAIKSLSHLGARLTQSYEAVSFYRTICNLNDMTFSITSTQDPNLFRVGNSFVVDHDICVVDLRTLLKMKAATLVSRCSEKDLFDLLWLLQQFKSVRCEDLVQLGQEIDAGVTGESILIGLSGAILSPTACTFSLDARLTPPMIHNQISAFHKTLIKGVVQYLKQQPVPPLYELIKQLKKWKRR